MISYLELMRPGNCVMSVIAVAVGALLAAGGNLNIFLDPSSPTAYIAMLVVFLVTGAGNAINDYTDIEADKINKPRRPIPSGRVSARATLWFTILLFVAGIGLSAFLTYFAFIIAVVNSIMLVIYSRHLQNKILLGNIAVGYLVGSTFLFGGAALGNLFLPFLLMILAMFSTISREVVKDLEDIEGDKKGFLKRLASGAKKVAERFGMKEGETEIKINRRLAKAIAIISMLVAITASPIPYVLGILGFPYLILLVPTVLIFISSIYMMATAKTRKSFARTSKIIKIGMNLGLLAYVVGIIF
jgi:geranylgeranylglycerol-phosphate geranylgeranyltransferase